MMDGIFGLACLLVLPWLKRLEGDGSSFTDVRGPARARGLATGLGLLCLAWVPYSYFSDVFGAGKPIMGTIFTVIFIGSALFLLAGKAVLGGAGGKPARLGAWIAPLLILMYARYFIDTISGWVGTDAWAGIAQMAFAAVPAVAGVLLLVLGNQSWQQMLVDPADIPASIKG
jgi:PAT family beta-lactamase induction signal transducer AmpG